MTFFNKARGQRGCRRLYNVSAVIDIEARGRVGRDQLVFGQRCKGDCHSTYTLASHELLEGASFKRGVDYEVANGFKSRTLESANFQVSQKMVRRGFLSSRRVMSTVDA